MRYIFLALVIFGAISIYNKNVDVNCRSYAFDEATDEVSDLLVEHGYGAVYSFSSSWPQWLQDKHENFQEYWTEECKSNPSHYLS